jgi:hypothetical protein
MDGDEAEEPMHTTPPPPSLPAVPEDEDEVSLQKFSGYVPVRINRGKNQGIRAYFLDYESPKVVLVRLDKDPLENATVFKSSISRITCSVNGCPHLAVKPKRTSPYDFASLLCSEH